MSRQAKAYRTYTYRTSNPDCRTCISQFPPDKLATVYEEIPNGRNFTVLSQAAPCVVDDGCFCLLCFHRVSLDRTWSWANKDQGGIHRQTDRENHESPYLSLRQFVFSI